MPKAFVCGCAALALSAAERDFLYREDPWGLILFKRNVADRDQLRELTRSFRECVGRADAPVMIDQEGGRVQRMAPPNWRAYPAAAAIEAGLEVRTRRGRSAACRSPHCPRSQGSRNHY